MENDGCGGETVPHRGRQKQCEKKGKKGRAKQDEHVRSLPREHCPMGCPRALLCIAFVLLRFQREHDGNPVRIVKLVHAVEFCKRIVDAQLRKMEAGPIVSCLTSLYRPGAPRDS